MTIFEQQALLSVCPPDVTLTFLEDEAPGFVRLQARPCPLYREGEGCRVYQSRPVNCRRYACGRDDVTTQPWEPTPIPARFFSDRAFRRQLVHIQQDAMRQWGHRMGWRNTPREDGP